MSFSLNRVELIGHLGADPEVRKTQAGDPVATLRIATSEQWKDKTTGERKERTEWHRVVIFNDALAKVAEQYLKKGAYVFIEGMLQTRKWTDQGGAERYSTEVVLKAFRSTLGMLDKSNRPAPAEGDYGKESTRTDGGTASRPAVPSARGPRNDMDDEIPF